MERLSTVELAERVLDLAKKSITASCRECLEEEIDWSISNERDVLYKIERFLSTELS